MMRINLLPVKAARKHVSARQELLVMIGAVGIIIAGMFALWTVREASIGGMEEKVSNIKQALEGMKKNVTKYEEFKRKAELVERKLSIIDKLKRSKIGPAKMLDDLATILNTHKKIWLTKLEEKDGTLTLEGGAMEHENISDFQVAMTRESKLFKNIELKLVSNVTKDGVSYLEWKIVCSTAYVQG